MNKLLQIAYDINNSKDICQISFPNLISLICAMKNVIPFKGIVIPETILISEGKIIGIYKIHKNGYIFKNVNQSEMNPRVLATIFNRTMKTKEEKAYLRFSDGVTHQIINGQQFTELMFCKKRKSLHPFECIQAYTKHDNEKMNHIFIDYIAPIDNLREDGTIIYKLTEPSSLNQRERLKERCIELCTKLSIYAQKVHKIVN